MSARDTILSGGPLREGLRPRRALLYLGVSLAAVAAGHALDTPAFHLLFRPEVEQHDWYFVLRALGDFRLWLAVAACWVAHDLALCGGARTILPFRRGLAFVLSSAGAGLIAEILKLVIGRERPTRFGEAGREFQGYLFKAWDPSAGAFGAWSDGSNLGIPSSHTAVAFAGAAALSRMVPGTAPVVLTLAAACAVSRMLTGAHFLSDCVTGAALGYAVGWVLTAHHARARTKRRGPHNTTTPETRTDPDPSDG